MPYKQLIHRSKQNTDKCSSEAEVVSGIPGADYAPTQPFKGIYCGTGGTLIYTDLAGNTITRLNVLAGMTHPWAGTGITDTGTTCTGIVVDR